MDFTKKFNVGLTLETNYAAFAAFLQAYHPYIHSFYFSPPLGTLYHTRSKVAMEFLLPGKKQMFFKMLETIAEYGIGLELLFNTLRLDEPLIEKAAGEMQRRQIPLESVCFLKPYYDAVARHFPEQKFLWSFNNGFQSKAQIDAVLDTYRADAVILGSSFIRNNNFFAHLDSRGCAPYLLLNNGCSFNCGTCNNTQSVCGMAFEENRKRHSVEYLYALQSIFPEELHSGLIDSSHIRCFKISNRSSDLRFLQSALDSYMGGQVRRFVEKDPRNYALWGRAGYFWKYYPTMDLDRILQYKEEILYRRGERRDG